jgi:hypothetical protein
MATQVKYIIYYCIKGGKICILITTIPRFFLYTTNNGAFLENLSNKKLTSLKVALYFSAGKKLGSHVAITIIKQIEWIEKGRHLFIFYWLKIYM